MALRPRGAPSSRYAARDRCSRAGIAGDAALSTGEMIRAIEEGALARGLPPALALALAAVESGGGKLSDIRQTDSTGETMRSIKGALGVMQLTKGTAADLGVDPTDALQNIQGGLDYFAQLLQKYRGIAWEAVAAYNSGPGRVDESHAQISKLPPETRQYVPRVMDLFEMFDAHPELWRKYLMPGPASDAAPSGDKPVKIGPAAFRTDTYDSGLSWLLASWENVQDSRPAWLRDASLMSEKAAAGNSNGFGIHDSLLNRDWEPVNARFSEAPLPTVNTQSSSVDFHGGIHVSVYITEPGADVHTIKTAVAEGYGSNSANKYGRICCLLRRDE